MYIEYTPHPALPGSLLFCIWGSVWGSRFWVFVSGFFTWIFYFGFSSFFSFFLGACFSLGFFILGFRGFLMFCMAIVFGLVSVFGLFVIWVLFGFLGDFCAVCVVDAIFALLDF